MTIKDVAVRAGVAPASVTRVLNGHPNVSDELRERVLAAVEETGYRPDLLASGLRRGASRTIGIIVSDIINPLLAEIVDHLEAKLHQAGYSVLLSSSHGDPKRDVESVMLLHQRRVDAFAVMCVDERNIELQQVLRGLPIPVVMLDREVEGVDAASGVLTDHYRSAYKMTEHLLDHGHERILHLGGPRGATHSGRERLRGFLAASHARGIDVPPELIRHGRPSFEIGRQVVREMAESEELPTAILVGPNPFLPGVLTELREQGIRVGVDIAFACLDDLPIAALHEPPLTALYRDTEEIAEVSADLILSQLSGTSRFPRTVVLPMELRLRASTKVTAEEVLTARRAAVEVAGIEPRRRDRNAG